MSTNSIQYHLFGKLDERCHSCEALHAKYQQIFSYFLSRTPSLTGSFFVTLVDRLINVPFELVSRRYRWPWSYSKTQCEDETYRLFAIDKSFARRKKNTRITFIFISHWSILCFISSFYLLSARPILNWSLYTDMILWLFRFFKRYSTDKSTDGIWNKISLVVSWPSSVMKHLRSR